MRVFDGKRLRELRQEGGITVRDVAERAGVTPSAIYEIEHGSNNPRVNALAGIADALDVTIDDLFTEVVEDGAA